MLKIKEVKRWDSVGDEFLSKLESKGIEYKVLYEGLKVFELASIGVAGGKSFNILDYKRKSDGQRVLVAHGGFGIGDSAVEEIYVIEVEDNQVVGEEDISELIRDYIKKEDEEVQKPNILEEKKYLIEFDDCKMVIIVKATEGIIDKLIDYLSDNDFEGHFIDVDYDEDGKMIDKIDPDRIINNDTYITGGRDNKMLYHGGNFNIEEIIIVE